MPPGASAKVSAACGNRDQGWQRRSCSSLAICLSCYGSSAAHTILYARYHVNILVENIHSQAVHCLLKQKELLCLTSAAALEQWLNVSEQ